MSKQAVTNEDILDILQDLMKMTGDGFLRLEGRMDGLEGRMDGLDGRIGGLERRMDGLDGRMHNVELDLRQISVAQTHQGRELREVKETVLRIDNEQQAQTNDINEILDRLTKLEDKVVT